LEKERPLGCYEKREIAELVAGAEEIGSSIGAGAIISLGKKMRALTATNATAKMSTINSGAIY